MRSRIASKLAETCEVVATAADGTSALSAIESLNPAVVILDVSMPGMSGLEVAARLRERGCAIQIVFFSAHDDEDFRRTAAELGAKAFVLKPNLAVLADAVRGCDGHPGRAVDDDLAVGSVTHDAQYGVAVGTVDGRTESVSLADEKSHEQRCSECGVLMFVAHVGVNFRVYVCPCCGVSVPEPRTVSLPPSVPMEKQ